MDILTTSPGASSSHPHHHHHHHNLPSHHCFINADGGSAEVRNSAHTINGRHAGKASTIEKSASSHPLQQDSRMSPKSEKGKAKETDDVRSPRRLAASRALQHVVRNSAPPASSLKATATSSDRDVSPPSSSSPSSPLKAGPDLASADADGAKASTSSSPSLLQSSSLLPNGFVRARSARTSSPSSSPLAGGRNAAGTPSPAPEMSNGCRTDIDEAEMSQFHFQAYSQNKTSILPRAPPTLPYDASYLPLSPMGIDQVGHTLQAAALPANGTSGKAAEAAKTGTKAGGQGRKVLPGQELESHIVSELPKQKAMPWGLQTTLLEKQHAGPRARTKSGVAKRTALREGRRSGVRARGNEVHDGLPPPLKVEDDLLSENDSPRLPLIQISSEGPDIAVPGKENAEGGSMGQENGEKSGKEETPSQVGDTEMMEATTTMESQAIASPASPAKGRARIFEHTPPASSSAVTTAVGEETSQPVENDMGNTRRPREAHKRLKIVGGYYRKPGKHREDVMQQSESSHGSLAGASRASNRAATTSSSRGTSFVPEDQPDTTVDARSSSEDALSGRPLGSRAASMVDEAAEGPFTTSVQPALAGAAAAVGTSLRRMTNAPPTQGSPSKLMHASGETNAADDNAEGNNEFCETCRGVGHFICCDGCPRSFHFACINPPLDVDELPKSVGDASDTWYCNVCRAERRPKARGGKNSSGGVLDPLVRYIDGENPSIFALPHDIRNYFKGVATANDGSYVDSSMLRSIKVNKYGVIDEREPLRLKDKNGKPIFCYRCGESAMPHEEEKDTSSSQVMNLSSSPQRGGRPQRQAAKIANAAVMPNSTTMEAADESKGWRKIISCDFCSLHWHLDCLDPPLAGMPSLSRKWMCPNHIEHVMPSERIPKSVANSTTVHELPVPSKETVGPGKHYRMRVVNDGQIDIIPDPLDTYTGPAHDGPDEVLPPSSSTKFGSSGEKGWVEMNLPAYKAYPTVFGSSNNVKLKYRIPEKVIRLDFWSKLDLHREQMAESLLRHKQSSDRQGLDMLALIANAASASTAFPAEGGNEGDTERKTEAAKKKLTKREAEDLTQELLFPPASSHQLDHPFVAPGDEPVSTLRQSYIPGEYEREFFDESEGANENVEKKEDKKSAALPAATLTANNTSTTYMAEPGPPSRSQSAHDLESSQFKAIQKIIAHKGKEALLRFLLE